MRSETIHKFEKTVYPLTQKGRALAEEMTIKLMKQHALRNWKEGLDTITVEAEYAFKIEDGEQE